MPDLLYNLIIFPLVQIIELCFFFVYLVAGDNPGAALLGVSLAVSVLTLPLYFRAEKWREAGRETQRRMEAKIRKIKAVFSGDEQYMILSAYYRQNHYHPVYALRNSFSLLIQVPFFIAAYSYLSRLEVLRGSSFLFIRDLGLPDGLISLGPASSLNLLPVVMTVLNCLSAALYAKGFPVKEKLQLYLTALVFLILLYNSPSGLVLYWTLNNLFSLAKNILVKIKSAKKLVLGLVFAAAAGLDVYVFFFHPGDLPNRLLACALFSAVFFIPPLARLPGALARRFGAERITLDPGAGNRCFILSTLILFVLAGLVIPGSLIASSVEEFSFIDSQGSPFPFIFSVLSQAAGFFIFWAPGLYFLFSPRTRQVFSLSMAALALGASVNVFTVSERFGFLTNTLIFSEPRSLSSGNPGAYALNLLLLAAGGFLILFLGLRGKRRLLFSLQIVLLASLGALGILNMARIRGDFAALRDRRAPAGENGEIAETYRLSKSGKNVMLFMLDAAVSGYVPYMFEEKPRLAEAYKDFTWFPNCVSFANYTLVGAPPLYGGYEYTPEAINSRDDVPLVEKHKEAYLLLPLMFSRAGYSVTVTDPPFDNYRLPNLEVFSGYPEIRAENIAGKYTSLWLNQHPGVRGISITNLLKANLIRFSLFKTAPLFLRYFIYDDGNWLGTENLRGGGSAGEGLTSTVINDYAFLDLLPRLTSSGGEGDTYTAVYLHLPHETALLRLPDYRPPGMEGEEEGEGAGGFAEDGRYHLNMASLLLMAKFMDFLKDEGIYDNTRIILVADHGRGSGDYKENITLPGGSPLQYYNPLLMFKDFNSRGGGLAVDNSFMTNGDAALFALKDLIPDPVNPFTNKELKADKDGGAAITTIEVLSSYRHGEYQYNIRGDQWLHVHSSIFDPANWSAPEK
ncbi:MAG: YidC/Oxa1 family membrane protein insertase [Treponema sp.]|jgi:YidC/Oxa1 family membrane protein insertase|nr:YidC/Oxa1 family membrane protein insertase [Treponema sp.]